MSHFGLRLQQANKCDGASQDGEGTLHGKQTVLTGCDEAQHSSRDDPVCISLKVEQTADVTAFSVKLWCPAQHPWSSEALLAQILIFPSLVLPCLALPGHVMLATDMKGLLCSGRMCAKWQRPGMCQPYCCLLVGCLVQPSQKSLQEQLK